MENVDKRLIFVLLAIIAISSLILVIKINLQPEYDPQLYARVYEEYRSVMNKDDNVENSESEQTEETAGNPVNNNNDNNNNNNSNNVNNTSSNNPTNTTGTTSTSISNVNTTYKYVSASNQVYTVEGEIMIPKIKLVYPIIKQTTDEYLKIAPTKLAGPNMNEVGNYCIAGHNYKNDQFFSHLNELDINDKVNLTSKNGSKLTYLVYNMYEVDENDLSCTNQDTNGRIEATLITCTTQKNKRLIVKCRALL